MPEAEQNKNPAEKWNSDELDLIDAKHSWHPFTQMSEYLEHPRVHITHGKACWLYDSKGKRYLDANASLWTNVHGHNDPELNKALQTQLEKIAHATHLGLNHPAAAKLSQKLCAISPQNLTRVFYSDNGSAAVEIALKLSLQYWQLNGQEKRKGIIAFSDAYHGDTFGAMSIGDSGVFHERFKPWFFPVHRVSTPPCLHYGGKKTQNSDATESLKQLEQVLQSKLGCIAAVILEPCLQGAAGMRFQPPGFLSNVQKLCKQHDVHLILDEVFTGFGRLNSLFACEQENVQPDFLCLAKGLSGGYLPLAATLSSENIYQAFLGTYDSYKAFFHGHTFTANPLGAATALASIAKLEKMIATGQLRANAQAFHEFFEQLADILPTAFKLRHGGLAGAIELPEGDAKQRRGMHFCLKARDHGIMLRPLGDILPIVPPLIAAEKEFAFLKEGLLKTLQAFPEFGLG